MEKQDLLKHCKLYDGNPECPKDVFSIQYGFLFWEAEELFVNKQDPEFVESIVSSFLNCGLAGECMSIPIQLRACLFSVFCKGADTDPESLSIAFKTNVLPKYLALP